MKEIDENGLALSKMQAEIFAGTLENTDCGSAVFIRRFMLSRFAKRMDKEEFIFEASGITDSYSEIEEEYGITSYGSEKYSAEELYWMGYIYRYWCYTYETESKKVYRIISPKELRKLYFPYHSLDPAAAIERILEASGKANDDIIKRGVEILRSKKRLR